eukprot:226820-Prorocentrum_minimum.AAC.5
MPPSCPLPARRLPASYTPPDPLPPPFSSNSRRARYRRGAPIAQPAITDVVAGEALSAAVVGTQVDRARPLAQWAEMYKVRRRDSPTEAEIHRGEGNPPH